MPKSRGRRPRKRHARSPRSSTTRRALLDPLYARLVEVDAAEAAGDAVRALALTRLPVRSAASGPFWRPWRIRRLRQMVEFGEFLPGWATSRWILEQAQQQLTESNRVRVLRALDVAIDVQGGLELPPGVDMVDARCRIMDGDWVFRQVHLYELGGLTDFLDHCAGPALGSGADHVREWARSPMDGYRLVASSARELTWESLSTQSRSVVTNLGGAAEMRPGEHVIGRLVPIRGGRMFETAPLQVDEEVAATVASRPADWVDVVTHASRQMGPATRAVTFLPRDFDLLTDVPRWLWRSEVFPDQAWPSVQGPDLGSAGLEVQDLLRLALSRERRLADDEEEPHWDVDPAACVAAALVDPEVLAHLGEACTLGDAAGMEVLATVLPAPASSLCSAVAFRLRTPA